MIRSLFAVLAGFFFIAALSFGADALLRATAPSAFDAVGRTDSLPLLLLTLAYVGVFAVSGCYLTARVAPNRPMLHALVLGLLGLVLQAAGTWAMWDTAPAWYHLASLSLVLPFAWLGGRMREVELARGDRPVPRPLRL